MKGDKFLERRQKLGLTQKLLAERLQVSRNTVARWERGEIPIPGLVDLALKTIEREKPRKRTPGPEKSK